MRRRRVRLPNSKSRPHIDALPPPRLFSQLQSVSLLLVSIVVDYAAALGMVRIPHRKKAFLWLSVCTNLSILGLFKYLDFFIESFGMVLTALGLGAGPEVLCGARRGAPEVPIHTPGEVPQAQRALAGVNPYWRIAAGHCRAAGVATRVAALLLRRAAPGHAAAR